jgi:cell division inhibitor SepF
MAGAMRKMGIYLGLVEDDDARAYGRYDARQTELPDSDRRYGRYEDSRYATDFVDDGYADEPYGDERYPASRDRFGAGYADDVEAEESPEAREPEPAAPRRPAARPLGLAPSSTSATPTRMGGSLGGTTSGAGAAGLAVREPVAAEPEPAPAPKEPYRITTVHPRTYNEARQIGERFREGGAVIMNLTDLPDADAKRLVDFAAGLIFGLRGSIERVTNKVFLLSPRDVDVTAEDKARIREGGFFNQS